MSQAAAAEAPTNIPVIPKKKSVKRPAPVSAEDLADGITKPSKAPAVNGTSKPKLASADGVTKPKSPVAKPKKAAVAASPAVAAAEAKMAVDETESDEGDAAAEEVVPKRERKKTKVREPIVKGDLPTLLWLRKGVSFLNEHEKVPAKFTGAYDMFVKLIAKLRHNSGYFDCRDSLLANIDNLLIIIDPKTAVVLAFVQLIPTDPSSKIGIIGAMQVFEPRVGIGSKIVAELKTIFSRLFVARFHDNGALCSTSTPDLYGESSEFWEALDVPVFAVEQAPKQALTYHTLSLVNVKSIDYQVLLEHLWKHATEGSGDDAEDDDEEYPEEENRSAQHARGQFLERHSGRIIRSLIYRGVKYVDSTKYDACHGEGAFLDAVKAARAAALTTKAK